MKGTESPFHSLSRTAKVETVRALSKCMKHRDVAEHLGVSRSTIRNLLNDPDGAKQAARRCRYQRPCPTCGRKMDGSGGFKSAPRLCADCAAERGRASAYWTPERLLLAARRWAELFGRAPGVKDWRRVQEIDGERFPCFAECYRHPNTKNANHGANSQVPWTNWADFIESAGLPRPRRGRPPKAIA